MQSEATTQNLSIPDAFNFARLRHLDGDLDQARSVYESILHAMPDHAQSVTMLASVAFQQGDEQAGTAYLDRAINLNRAAMQRVSHDLGVKAFLVNLLLARNLVAEAEALIPDLTLALNPVRATNEEFAARRESGIARKLPAMVISTIPKSASESIWNKLVQGLGVAQCYLSLGLFPECCLVPSRVEQAAEGGVITKEHFAPTPHNLATLEKAGLNRVVVHHRDPRQATLSWAHFVRDDINKRLMAPLWRKIVPPAEILSRDLSAQIDWNIDHYLPLLIKFLQDWRQADADPDRAVSVLFMSFETFRREPADYFDQVLAFYDVPKERFTADADAEVVHLRKGEIDEWRGVFTEAQRQRAWDLIPADLAEAFSWEP